MPADRIVIPRLSESLRPLTWPYRCQRCDVLGGDSAYERLTVWQEHDDDDRPECRYVLLCPACADRLIEPHPRLYRRLAFQEPAPGILRICAGCAHQMRVFGSCDSPYLFSRGGPGLPFRGPDSQVHVQRAGPGGRGRRGGWESIWNEEPSQCVGFEPRKEVAREPAAL